MSECINGAIHNMRTIWDSQLGWIAQCSNCFETGTIFTSEDPHSIYRGEWGCTHRSMNNSTTCNHVWIDHIDSFGYCLVCKNCNITRVVTDQNLSDIPGVGSNMSESCRHTWEAATAREWQHCTGCGEFRCDIVPGHDTDIKFPAATVNHCDPTNHNFTIQTKDGIQTEYIRCCTKCGLTHVLRTDKVVTNYWNIISDLEAAFRRE